MHKNTKTSNKIWVFPTWNMVLLWKLECQNKTGFGIHRLVKQLSVSLVTQQGRRNNFLYNPMVSFLFLLNIQKEKLPDKCSHIRKKRYKSKFKNFINKKFRNYFCSLTCIFFDYMGHENSKEFWKSSCFENMTADFLRIVKIHFGKIAQK